MTSAFGPFLKKLSRHGPPSRTEEAALLAAFAPTRTLQPGEEILRQFSEPSESTLLVSGLCGRLVSLAGGAQQLTALHVAGDFVDLHAFVLGRMDHSVVALTPCEIATIGHSALRNVTKIYPRLARSLWFLTMVDAATHRQWLTMLGRRDALQRGAHLVCELYTRLSDVGLTDGGRFGFPMTQAAIGDVLCLSKVHVNRVVKDLRAHGLVSWNRREIEILDWPGLVKLAEFEPTYLQLETVPDPGR